MPGTNVVPSKGNMIAPPVNAPRPNFLSAIAFALPTAAGALASVAVHTPLAMIAGVGLGIVAALSPKIAQHWERAVVLRFGRYQGLRGPGPFFVIPFVDSVSAWVDQRTVTTAFTAEETLTSDTVPVNVDAVLFWTVYDPEKAALEVQDYTAAISWASQTALRDIIGRTSLSELLRGRVRIEKELQALIDERTTPWGVTVHSVEMRDVVIPAALQDAMSREAQASREKSARIILGEAEVAIAELFEQAAERYRDNPTALQLRQMNILYEALKQKGGMMVIPSSIVESMGPAGVMSTAALASQAQARQDAAPDAPAAEPARPPALPPTPDLRVFGGA